MKNKRLDSIMKDTKSRNKILFLGAMVIVFLGAGGYFVVKSTSQPNYIQQGSANVIGTPTVSTAPGVSNSVEYNRKIEELNTDRTQVALNTNQTFIPTPVNKNAFNVNSPLDKIDTTPPREQEPLEVWVASKEVLEENCPSPKTGKLTKTRNYEESSAGLRRNFGTWTVNSSGCKDPVVVRQPQPQPVKVVDNKGNFGKDDLVIIANLMSRNQNKPSTSEFNYAGQKNEESIYASLSQNGNNQVASQNVETNQKPVVPAARAGDIFYGVLITPVNTDEPSVVLATVNNGPLKGARLIGSQERLDKTVVLKFNTANVPGVANSIQINAIAIDDIGKTSLAEEVNNHYFLRYSAILGSAFLTGWSNAIGRQNTTVTNNPFGGTTVTQGELDSKQINRQALGEVGRAVSNEVRQNGNLDPTVYVNKDGKGTAIGILLLSDLVL